MATEIWKKITLDNGKMIKVSSLGNIQARTSHLFVERYAEFTSRLTTKGYPYVNLFYKTYFVHRLVAIAFHSNPYNKPEVNHKNGIKTDNRAINLEWVTSQENNRHSYHVLDTNSQYPKRKVEIYKNGKLITTAISVREAARIVGGDSTNVSAVCNGKITNGKRRRTHMGHTFMYA